MAITLFILSFVFISIGLYYKLYFSNLSIETLIYTIKNPVNGADFTIIFKIFWFVIIFVFVAATISLFLNRNNRTSFFLKRHKKLLTLLSLILLFLSIFYDIYEIGLFKYLTKINQTSDFYTNNYKQVFLEDISGDNTNNLIYIYLESMDNDYLYDEENCLKELKYLANENLNFSDNKEIGGSYPIFGATFTIGSMYAQSFGMSINNHIDKDTSTFTSNMIGIGDILHDHQYIQEFMVGQESTFSNTDKLFNNHGFNIIYDINNYNSKPSSNKEERNEWGLPDYLLFEEAKTELSNLAKNAKKQNVKFNFTMATIDCHFPTGYPCAKCPNEFDIPYKNIYACQSRNVYEFVQWIKEQEFYKDTTIVLSGDHINFNSRLNFDSNLHTVYNCIINSKVLTDNSKSRLFSVCDLFPTTLASLGFELKHDRMGVGTNLFSNKATIFEEFGVEFVNDEISKLWIE